MVAEGRRLPPRATPDVRDSRVVTVGRPFDRFEKSLDQLLDARPVGVPVSILVGDA
ncbi:hypothetical protein [Haladaptatus sp. R4]|uniref:hypothetical protein n=1 Tax=Haladaptatus sp. R4 TaxID=1679489 RepID=UPI001CBE51EE|nr:hypothetical protein [Haladaptatus sp. R4]